MNPPITLRPPGTGGIRRRAWWSLLAVTALLASLLYGAAFSTAPSAHAESNGAAVSPQSGWSSWSFIRKNPTEAAIEAQAAAMASTGLVSHGFSLINIDDFYYLSPGSHVDSYGRWVVDTAKFPHGMKAVADYVHGKGEKFGMYLTPGIPVAAYNQNTPIQGTSYHARDIVSDTTDYEKNYNFANGAMYFIDYAKNPAAAQAFVNSWANLLASYGVDYLKMDGVGTSDKADVQHWSQALAQSGRTIQFELSNSLDINQGPFWKQYANGWRVGGDVECYCSTLTNWSNVSKRFNTLPAWVQYDSPGGWGDPDSVEVGNGSQDGLTPDERRTQLSLWAISAAPLTLGTDLTHMDSGDLALLTDDEVLGVDRAGHPAHPVAQGATQQTWWAYNGDGTYTVGLFNLAGSAANVTANWSDLGFTGGAAVRDLWSRTNLGSSSGKFTASVPAHGSRLLRVTPASGHGTIGAPMVSKLSGRCADSPQGTTYNAVQVQVWTCNGGPNQNVTYNSSSKTLVLEGKCFDAHNNQKTAGTHVEIYDCNGGANQQWTKNSNGTITGVQSGLCLDVTGATNPNGSGLELWTCNGGQNQQWTLG
ncbi:Ricin B lectin [Catenulispora acidiphila DSM 44928]|uniref:Alpha-galactosidase n=1 Tax=Catenulispora acidiphila (strain DSM 44928 / JCM 14897 / NBRC 102108 / NRRL B-24433 / ID139908) TaxID=479433 RepID=C7Q3E7_CATAD|nr:glycoside hydrolase family 27 protein [Catenulispora acidiphila]ACU75712.1 Ricin B lectin [Catenulispora acidiphila DSM 44928]